MKTKFIFWLILEGTKNKQYRAVVIESTKEAAKQRACMMDKHLQLRDWRQARVALQARVPHTRTPAVLAMDGV